MALATCGAIPRMSRVGAAARWRQRLPQALPFAGRTENEIGVRVFDGPGKRRVMRGRVRAHFEHVAKHGDAAPPLRAAEQCERRRHRGRIGVVAFVDDFGVCRFQAQS